MYEYSVQVEYRESTKKNHNIYGDQCIDKQIMNNHSQLQEVKLMHNYSQCLKSWTPCMNDMVGNVNPVPKLVLFLTLKTLSTTTLPKCSHFSCNQFPSFSSCCTYCHQYWWWYVAKTFVKKVSPFNTALILIWANMDGIYIEHDSFDL